MTDELIQITPFGLLTTNMDDDHARLAIDALELFCRRHNRAIAVDVCGTFRFVELQRCEDATQPDPLADHPQLF